MKRHLALLGLVALGFSACSDIADPVQPSAAPLVLASGLRPALNAGDVVVFLLPAGGHQPDPHHAATDTFIYTGGQVTRIDAFGCYANTSAPVQNAALVERPGGRSGRIVGVVTVARTGGSNDPVGPGTRLTSLILEAWCTAGGTAYLRYRGTVD